MRGSSAIRIVILLLFAVVQSFLVAFLVHRNPSNGDNVSFVVDRSIDQSHAAPSIATSSHLNDESNIPIPTHADGTPMSLQERLRYVELKLNAFINFSRDPFFGSKRSSDVTCKQVSSLIEFGCKEGLEGYYIIPNEPNPHLCPGMFDHNICLDNLPQPLPHGTLPSTTDDPPCLVYDFGVREQPQFGAVMARTFGCEVHAFDPSPVSTKWWESENAQRLRDLPNYHFHPYGAGGVDGDLVLNEYNWGQVSIVKYPSSLVDCGEDLDKSDPCKIHYQQEQSTFKLKVKTLPTIMRELGHDKGRKIDILKIDVEGSEYSFLENIFDTNGGCPDYIDQVTLEWHHYPFDPRYGEGSSPPINVLVTLLHACGLHLFHQHSQGGWPSADRIYKKLGMNDVRYNLATFIRKGSAQSSRHSLRALA